jgi:hypothetical protein
MRHSLLQWRRPRKARGRRHTWSHPAAGRDLDVQVAGGREGALAGICPLGGLVAELHHGVDDPRGQFVGFAYLGHHLGRSLGQRADDVLREFIDDDTLGDELFEGGLVVGVEIRSHEVVLGIGRDLDQKLQILGQLAIGRLVDRDLERGRRLDDARRIIVVAHAVQAEGEVVPGTDPFGRVQRARLQRGEDFAARQRLHVHADPAPDLAAEAGGAEGKTLQIVDACDLVGEPAGHLRAGIAAHPALQAELVIELVPEFLPATMIDPGVMLVAQHGVGSGGEEVEAGMVALPVIGRGVHHLRRSRGHGVEGFERRHQFAGAIDGDRQAAIAHGVDAVGEALRAHAQARKARRPGGDHAPLDALLRDRGGRERRCGGRARAGQARLLDE